MKNLNSIGGNAQTGETTTNNDCKIYYTVTLEIDHVDKDGEISEVLYQETEFKEPTALAARRKAFAYAYQLYNDADIDGKLCDGHIDSRLEGDLKGNKDINMLFLNIDAIDDEGSFLTIFETQFNAPETEELEALSDEYNAYLRYGYDTGGDPHIVEDEDEWQYEIINFANSEASDSFYIVELRDTIDQIKGNGIRAKEDGYIVLLTQTQIADNYVLNQLLYAGKYPLIKISARGITGVIKPYITGELAAFHQRLVKQDKIEPQYIKSVQECDSRELKLYFDYNAKKREIFPEMVISLDAYREHLRKFESTPRYLDQSAA